MPPSPALSPLDFDPEQQDQTQRQSNADDGQDIEENQACAAGKGGPGAEGIQFLKLGEKLENVHL